MRIGQISAGDALTKSVVSRMLQYSTALQLAEFYRMIGNAEYSRKVATATGGQFRALNDAYADNKVNPAFDNPVLTILGDKVQVDQAHERRGQDIASVRASELLNFAGNLGKTFQAYFFNGDSTDPVQFDGLAKIVPAGQVITAAANGHAVVLGNSDANKNAQQKFLELLDQLIESVDGGAQALFADGKTISRLSTIARDFITTTVNEFGVPIKYYNGIPIYPSGYDRAGARIIGHAESCGNSALCTSMYALRFGERADLTLPSNVGIEVKDLQLVGSHYVHQVELDLTLSLLNPKAVARLQGLIIN